MSNFEVLKLAYFAPPKSLPHTLNTTPKSLFDNPHTFLETRVKECFKLDPLFVYTTFYQAENLN